MAWNFTAGHGRWCFISHHDISDNAGLNCYYGMCLANSVPQGWCSCKGTPPQALNISGGFFVEIFQIHVQGVSKLIWLVRMQYGAILDCYICCVGVITYLFCWLVELSRMKLLSLLVKKDDKCSIYSNALCSGFFITRHYMWEYAEAATCTFD